MTNQFALEVTNLTKTYKSGTKALNKVNLTINQGDFFGLLGANGAGKTTLIGILTGLVNKTSGTLKVHNLDWGKHTNQVKEMIGVVPQEFNFSIFEKVEDIVLSQAGFFGVDRKTAIARTAELLQALDLQTKSKQIARTLSGGMKRRLMIARALVHKPKFLILDEPTAGVDVELRYGMWEYLKNLNQTGTTILLTTHYLEEAEQLCKNIAIIKNGEIVRKDSTKNLLASIEEESYLISVTKIPHSLKTDFQVIDNQTIEVTINPSSSINNLVVQLNEQKIQMLNIKPKGNRLEQLFLNSIKQ